MPPAQEPGGLLEFGPFRLDCGRRLLWRRDRLLPVAPKAVDLLRVLSVQAGQVVGKQELLERVWPDSFVEEANLSVNVSALRKALGRQADGRAYIETVSRRGYRFAGRVRQVPSLPRSLAVLPFRSLSGNEDEALGLGMADALITRLGRLGQLSVRPTGAVVRYGPQTDPLQAGRELRVEAVVEGRIQRDLRQLRVTVQLVSVAGGMSLWAESFDTPFTRVLAVQDAIAGRVARALSLRLSPVDWDRLLRHHTESVEAYQAYLKGRYFWNKLTGPWLEKAREAFGEALARDPGYAPALAALADTETMLGLYALRPPREAFSRARAAAERALALDPDLAEPHVSLAFNHLFLDWGWAAAERELERALELAPTSAEVRQWHALYLGMTGRFG